jgi:uncharacterized protein YbjT (DUF2867 family)
MGYGGQIMNYTVTTPTGHIGSRITDNLLKAGKKVKVVARDRAKVADFVNRGATAVEGDLEDKEFLTQATAGTDVLFWLTPPNFTVQDFRAYQNNLGSNAASAIAENKIPYVVNLSSLGAHLANGNGPVNGLHDVEQAINEVAANVTHLRPTAFMENVLNSLGGVKQAGAIFLPVDGTTAIPMIASQDIGDFATEVMVYTTWTGKNVKHLWGPKEYSYNQVAKILTHVLEKEVNHVQVTPQQAKEAMTGMGLTEDLSDQYLELYNSLSEGTFTSGTDNPDSRGTTTFEEFARNTLRPIYAGM